MCGAVYVNAQNGNTNSNAGAQATNKLTPTGMVGVGTMTPRSELEVIGKTDLKGELEVQEKAVFNKELHVGEKGY
ncbi:MAG: hypothetical protein JKY42_01915, partial [Flavobacteriales bacterium]|nr:hypothetical protein [Flavobacteriales bacterium]